MDKPKDDNIIFRAWITDRNGRKIYASWFGKKAFPIRVADDDSRKQLKLPGFD